MSGVSTLILNYLPYVAVIAALHLQWLLSNGDLRKGYKVAIIVYLSYAVIETTIAVRYPEQLHILVFNVVNIWSIAMAIKGLLRLKREEHESTTVT